MKLTINLIGIMLAVLLCVGLVMAGDPFRVDENLDMGTNNIYNASNITATYFIGDGSGLTDVTASVSNSTTWWASLTGWSSTIFENVANELSIKMTWFNSSVDARITSSEPDLNVNSSNYWDDLNTPGDINAGDITDDGTYVKTVGDTMSGDLDMGGNDVLQAGNLWNRTRLASTVLNYNSGGDLIGFPSLNGATYNTVGIVLDLFSSAGRATGGIITVDGATINITSGAGFIKATDNDTAELMSFDWSDSTGFTVPTNTIMYYGVDYNGGSPIITNRTTDTWDLDTQFPLGSVINQNGELYVLNNPWWVTDGITNIIERFQAEGHLERDDNVGGLILGYTGTRNPTMTEGTLWSRLTEHEMSAFDASGADDFDYYYRTADGNYTKQSNRSQWNVTHYDDGSGTLATIGNNQYAVIWAWSNVAIDEISLMFPQNTYATSALAEAEEIPNTYPTMWYEGGIIIGRIIIKQNTDAPVEIQSVFTTTFTAAEAADHANLANLAYSSSGHTGFASTVELGLVNSTAESKHTPGDCPAGEIVQNTTISGVECVAAAGAGTVTSVATDDVYVTGGPITSSGTVGFNSTLAGTDLKVNGSDYWDDLGSPSDISAGDITDDGTYLTSYENLTDGNIEAFGYLKFLNLTSYITDSNTSWVNALIDTRVVQSFVQALGFYTKTEVYNTTEVDALPVSTFSNDVGYFDNIVNFTGTLTDAKWCVYNSGNGEIDCNVEPVSDTTYTAGNGISEAATVFSVAGNTALTQDADGLSVTADAIGDTQLEYDTGQALTTTSNPTFNNQTITDCIIFASGGKICSGS